MRKDYPKGLLLKNVINTRELLPSLEALCLSVSLWKCFPQAPSAWFSAADEGDPEGICSHTSPAAKPALLQVRQHSLGGSDKHKAHRTPLSKRSPCDSLCFLLMQLDLLAGCREFGRVI